MADVLCEIDAGIATLTLNRPDRLNAMGGEILPLVRDELERIAADASVSVAVLTGAGRGFCVGGDLSGDLPRELRVPDLGADDARQGPAAAEVAGKARELYLLSDRFGAEEAERIGLVAKVVPDAELMPTVRGVAERLRKKAPLALRAIKQNLAAAEHTSISEQLDREAVHHARLGRSADAREAARAFLEKREPRFEGR